MHKILFYNNSIICPYMFRALCAHHQDARSAKHKKKHILCSVTSPHPENRAAYEIMLKNIIVQGDHR